MTKKKLATVWLDGCSGCHMSFLDIDERLLELADLIELVYSPLVDNKVFPDEVDITLVEGAISSEEDLEKIKHIRQHTKVLIAMGDCAVTANVPSMRNPFGVDAVLHRAYLEEENRNPQIPTSHLPRLLPQARPVHTAVNVDVYLTGCPPSAKVILFTLTELLNGRTPSLQQLTRFGA
ncbi:MAG: NADP oxidoreductase [Anaerolineaceae bacterium]|nr:NADP oxidoreductase [Anaerolineaceae bacterium]